VDIIGNNNGVDASGSVAISNSSSGVYLNNGTINNTIGRESVGERNIISANTNSGIYIVSTGTNDNTIQNNYIGTNPLIRFP